MSQCYLHAWAPTESKIRVLGTVRRSGIKFYVSEREVSHWFLQYSVPHSVLSPLLKSLRLLAHLKTRNMWLIFLIRTFRAIDSYGRSQGIISERLLPQRPHGLTERHVRKGHLITWNIQRTSGRDGRCRICDLPAVRMTSERKQWSQTIILRQIYFGLISWGHI